MKFLISILFLLPSFCFAELDSSSSEALEKTMELLANAQKRQKLINEDAKAKKADDIVQKLGGSPDQNQQLYEVASQIFKGMVEQNNGDVEGIKKQLQQNPEAFANSLDASHLQLIKKLASDLEQTQNRAPNSP